MFPGATAGRPGAVDCRQTFRRTGFPAPGGSGRDEAGFPHETPRAACIRLAAAKQAMPASARAMHAVTTRS